MATQFSTEAANADVMGEDAQTPGAPQGMPHAIGADGTPRDPSDRTPEREKRGGDAKADEGKSGKAKPGKDINAAGFVKDKDAGKP
jgi:hypothetical protein